MGCPYMKEEGVGSYFCSVMGSYVSRDHFSRYCYQSLDYQDCPTWNHHDYEQRAEGHSGAEQQQGGGCYLTTACTVSRNLPDNCMELTTLRWFRDNYLSKRENGSHEIGEYYYIAPKIVDKINQSPNADNVWSTLYDSLILPCVKLIKDGKYEETYQLYKKVTKQLKAKYLD